MASVRCGYNLHLLNYQFVGRIIVMDKNIVEDTQYEKNKNEGDCPAIILPKTR